jgi:metal-responsive CopG/Arc/MetJ family transcriptional regulator
MGKKNMKVMTFSIPSGIIEAINALRDTGIYSSRSEVLRFAILDFFQKGGSLPPTDEPMPSKSSRRRRSLRRPNLPVPLKPLQKKKLMSASLSPLMLNKLDECVVHTETKEDEIENRSHLLSRILKEWLPGAIKVTQSIKEAPSVNVARRKMNRAKSQFDFRLPGSRELVIEILSRMK